MARNPSQKKKRRTRLLLTLGIVAVALALLLIIGLLRSLDGAVVRQEDIAPGNDLPINVRKAEQFQKREDGRISYPGARTGIDVSSHQGQIDWQRVKADGVDFAILRAGFRGYSAGGLVEDECFRANLEGAKQAGVSVGVYFFSQAITTAEAEEEADYVLSLLRGESLDYPIFYDWEETREENSRTVGRDSYDVGDFALAFCKRIAASGYTAGVYFNQRYGYTIMQLEQLQEYAFWLAEYRDAPSFLYDFQVWQYSGEARVDGIDTVVDLDLYFAE